jgi:hypothetical protein
VLVRLGDVADGGAVATKRVDGRAPARDEDGVVEDRGHRQQTAVDVEPAVEAADAAAV